MKKLLDPIVSMHYDYENGEPKFRANCPKCGAMVYETCGTLPLKEVLEMERPYCQHCGTHLSAKFEMDEKRYVFARDSHEGQSLEWEEWEEGEKK